MYTVITQTISLSSVEAVGGVLPTTEIEREVITSQKFSLPPHNPAAVSNCLCQTAQQNVCTVDFSHPGTMLG